MTLSDALVSEIQFITVSPLLYNRCQPMSLSYSLRDVAASHFALHRQTAIRPPRRLRSNSTSGDDVITPTGSGLRRYCIATGSTDRTEAHVGRTTRQRYVCLCVFAWNFRHESNGSHHALRRPRAHLPRDRNRKLRHTEAGRQRHRRIMLPVCQFYIRLHYIIVTILCNNIY